MIEIPSNILNLLKSRQQIGENRPTAKVILKDAPLSGTIMPPWSDGAKIRVDETGDDYTGGSFVRRSDGLTLVTYGNTTDGYIYLATVLNEKDIFDIDNISAPTEWPFMAPPNGVRGIPSRLFKRQDGTILLFVMDPGKLDPPNSELSSITVYKSMNGLGTNFEYLSTVPATGAGNFATVSNEWEDGFAIGVPITLSSGRIIFTWNGAAQDDWPGSYRTNGSFVSHSDDGGVTWSTQCLNRSWTAPCKGPRFTCLAVFNGSLYAEFAGWDTFQNVGVFYSHDDGATWGFTRKNSTIWEGCFWGSDGYNYYTHQPRWLNNFIQLYRRPDTDDVGDGTGLFDVTANWELLRDTVPFQSGNECIWITENHWIAVVASGGGAVTIWGVEEEVITIPVKAITVSRSKGSASQATIEIPNTNGQYAPDPAGPWNHVMWPNKAVKIQLGYGQYLPQVFSGLIDDVDMNTPPQMLSITARDRTKLALDQICQWTWDGITYYDGAFAAQDPEGIFLGLAVMAGWSESDVIVEATGIIIPEFKFSQQTYGDLFQSLAEKAGCEWFEEENTGKLRFRPVTYPENPTPAYEFVAGVDIFSLGYKISDAEVYRDVVVTAQDTDGNTVSAKATWSAADYYGLPAHKTLLVTAGDMVNTEAGCLEIAQRLCTAMNSKPRQVQFVAVGIPNLQIGDCIQVTEASSTISEIYRVYDFEHQFDAEGSPVFATAIKCYWYAHG